MRLISPTLDAYLNEPDSFRSEVLITVNARDRTTGLVEMAGFWTGDRHKTFDIGGVPVIFYGAGSLIEVPTIAYESGLGVSTFDIEFSPLTPEFIQAVRVYDVRQQEVAIYSAYFDTNSEKLIEAPTRVYKGRSDQLNIIESEEGDSDRAVLTIVSSARSLTRTLTAKHSDETMRQRSGDGIGRYTVTAGAVQVLWGRTTP